MVLAQKYLEKKITLVLLLLVYSLNSAAINPIDAKLIDGFPSSVSTNGNTYAATYTFTSNIPFTMVSPFEIIKRSNPSSEFSYNDECSGKFLAYKESCTVNIYLRPTSNGVKTVSLTESYGNDRVPVSPLSTSASGGGGTSPYVTGGVIIALPANSQVGIAQPWKFEFKNTGTQNATNLNLNVTGSDGGYTDGCTGTLGTTSPGNTCTLNGTYTPGTTAPHSVIATLNYTQGSPVEVATSTNGNQGTGLSCTTQVGFAPQTLISATVNNITLLCSNNTNENITIDSHTTSYPEGGANGTFTVFNNPPNNPPPGNNCVGTLAPTQACQLKGDYTAPGTAGANVTVSLLVNYHTPSKQGLVASTSTSTSIVTTITNTRTFTINNNCPFDVWWGLASGAAKHLGSCSSDNDCAGGAAICNTNNHTCYYKTDWSPTGGEGGNPYHLTHNGGTATVTINQNAASGGAGNILWSGLISGSTVCNGGTCQNNPCGNAGGTRSCSPGVGFDQPATEAEFTLLLQGQGNVDSYDISNVNGVSIPMSMSTTGQTVDGFTCGNAGNPSSSGSLGACNYSNVTPPSYVYYWVTETGTACTAGNTCTNPNQICGYYKNGSSFVKNCGDFRGYWSANEICQTNPSFSENLGNGVTCSQVLGSPFPPPNGTIANLLKCTPPDSSGYLYNSCYLPGLSGNASQCCGCTNWANTAATSQCTSPATNPQWTTYILNLIKWQKKACTTSYSYPYDDPSSSFKCTSSPTTNYTITFCPGGVTALPAGNYTDGRG